jgi:ABC-type Fe3+ transport system substrate-binding protein
MRTNWIAVLLGSILGAATFSSAAFAQTIPDPKDEAALFANAKSAEGGKIVWYLNQPLEPLRVIADEFEKQYPGMHIEMQRLIGMQLMQRFVREVDAKQDIADVVQISDPVLMKELGDKGYLAHWKVPTFDRIPDSFKLGDLSYTVIITDMAILYNPNKLTKEEVDFLQADWGHVADPRFKGRFAVANNKCGICYTGVSFFLDPALKDKYGPDFLVKVAKNSPSIYSDSVVAIDRVIAGEHDFLFWFTEGPGVAKYMQGAPMRWIEPSPRAAYANAIQGISATAPHPNGARLFQNWLNSEAGVKALQDKYGVRTALVGIPDNRAIAKEPWFPHPKDYTVDFDRWAKEYDSAQDFWIKALAANREH